MSDKRPPNIDRLTGQTYSEEELWNLAPLAELLNYQSQVKDWNKTAPVSKKWTEDYQPESLRHPLRGLLDIEGTEGYSRWPDFVPYGTLVKFDAPIAGWGQVDHDTPRTIQMGGGGPSTLFHEAAHVDSLTGPLQAYFLGHRMYPGYNTIVQNAADNMRSEHYKKGDYGGYEEDAARLRAAYAMAPKGTSFNEFFNDAINMDTMRSGRRYDKVPGNPDIVERGVNPKTKEAALKMLEHTLFPRMRFIEENKQEPSVLQKLRDLLDSAKSPIGEAYDRYLSGKRGLLSE